MLGVTRYALGIRKFIIASTAEDSISLSPEVATITGSTTIVLFSIKEIYFKLLNSLLKRVFTIFFTLNFNDL